MESLMSMAVLRRPPIRTMALAATLALAGCTTREVADDSLYVALGEMDGIRKLVDALIVEYRADDRINQLFAETEFGYFGDRLVEDVCVKAGGPCEYTGLSMPEAHSGMNIRPAEFNWFVEDSRRAMEKIGLPVGTQNRLLAILARERGDVVGQ
jgi:hemoglobin